jgi:peptide/nickel transport system permease protein
VARQSNALNVQSLDLLETTVPQRKRKKGKPNLALIVGCSITAFIFLILIITPWIAPYNPATQDLANRLQGPSAEHWLGTDQLGRDLFTRILYGGRFSVTIAAVALLISAGLGTLLGVIAALRPGAIDETITRIADVLMSFPEMVVAMLVVAILGPNEWTLILALCIGGWTPFARLTRGVASEVNARGFIEAAHALGSSQSSIIFRHILPNSMSPLLAHGALRFGHKLITVGALSFLGLGVQPPSADWGAMLSEAREYMTSAPGLVFYPGLAVFITALGVTLIGQGLNSPRSGAGRKKKNRSAKQNGV